MNKVYILTILFIFPSILSLSQGTGIGTDSPHSSAELHVHSKDKGVLLPRLDSAQMNAISSPLEGLLIYNTQSNRFMYWHSGQWTSANFSFVSSISDDDNDTRIETESNKDEDTIRFAANADGNNTYNGTDDEVAKLSASGFSLKDSSYSYQIGSKPIIRIGNGNLGLGFNVGADFTVQSNNTFAGASISQSATGSNNTAVGTGAGKSLTYGNFNTFLGADAGRSQKGGALSVAIGAYAGKNLNSGRNTMSGYNSAPNFRVGVDNLFIGNNTASIMEKGSNNIFIGHNLQGANLATDSIIDSLNIANLITGNLTKKQVTFNNAYTFPDHANLTDAKLTFVSDGAGNIRWDSLNTSGYGGDAFSGIEGAAADMKTFNRVMGSGYSGEAMQHFTWLVEVVAYVDADINYISTFIRSYTGDPGAPFDMHLGIFDKNRNLLGYGIVTVTYPQTGYVTVTNLVDPTGTPLPTGIRVEAGEQYYLGAHSMAYSTPANKDIYIMQVQDNNARAPREFDSAFSQFKSSYSTLSTTDKTIWLRAY